MDNNLPKRFGHGKGTHKPWECICGHVNKRYLVQCGMCELRRNYVAQFFEEIESAKRELKQYQEDRSSGRTT